MPSYAVVGYKPSTPAGVHHQVWDRYGSDFTIADNLTWDQAALLVAELVGQNWKMDRGEDGWDVYVLKDGVRIVDAGRPFWDDHGDRGPGWEARRDAALADARAILAGMVPREAGASGPAPARTGRAVELE